MDRAWGGSCEFWLHLDFIAAQFSAADAPLRLDAMSWASPTWSVYANVKSRLILILIHRLRQLVSMSTQRARGRGINPDCCCYLRTVASCVLAGHWRGSSSLNKSQNHLKTQSTNIYNFIDSLLVQDVHSYFVNQKGKKQTVRWFMFRHACIWNDNLFFFLMGTTNSMEYCSVQPSLKCL